MKAKEYLSKVHAYRKAIESTQQRIDELYVLASGVKAIVYDKDRVQVTPDNQFEEFMVQIDAEVTRMTKQIRRYQNAVSKRQRQIANMGRPEYADILRLRYIETDKYGEQISLERIACIMHRSYYSVKHLHGRALQEFERRYLKS